MCVRIFTSSVDRTIGTYIAAKFSAPEAGSAFSGLGRNYVTSASQFFRECRISNIVVEFHGT